MGRVQQKGAPPDPCKQGAYRIRLQPAGAAGQPPMTRILILDGSCSGDKPGADFLGQSPWYRGSPGFWGSQLTNPNGRRAVGPVWGASSHGFWVGGWPVGEISGIISPLVKGGPRS